MANSILSLALLFLIGTATLFAQPTNSEPGEVILGEWINEKKDAKFQIFKQSNKYFGKILWGTGSDHKDVKNPDPKLRNRELVGLVILNNFSFDGKDTWENGTIYDPKDGKIYSCKLTLKSTDKLNVRGYVGISMFGRSETWTRIK